MNTGQVFGMIISDIDYKEYDNGTERASFIVSVPDDYKDKKTNYLKENKIPFVAWGNHAKYINNYFKKFDYFSGQYKVVTSEYENEGKKTYSLDLTITKVNNLPLKVRNISKEVKAPKYSKEDNSHTDQEITELREEIKDLIQ